jgi:hypothetical protein
MKDVIFLIDDCDKKVALGGVTGVDGSFRPAHPFDDIRDFGALKTMFQKDFRRYV